MSRESVPTLPPDAEPTEGDFEDDTDVDAALRKRAAASSSNANSSYDDEDDTIPTLPPEGAELQIKPSARSWAPTTTKIVEMSGDLITRQVAEEWRAAAQEEFERRVAEGVPPEQAAEEAIAKYLPITREPDTF